MSGSKVSIDAEVKITPGTPKEEDQPQVPSSEKNPVAGVARLQVVGFYLRYKTTKSHVRRLFLAAVEKKREPEQLPLLYVKMPCGREYEFTYNDFPADDLPCKCGNPFHKVVKYESIETPGIHSPTQLREPPIFSPRGRTEKGKALEGKKSGVVPEGDLPKDRS